MKLNWKITSICALGLTLLYMLVIPFAINSVIGISKIETKIYQTSGLRFDFGKARVSMGAFPSLWLKSDHISILNKDGSKSLEIKNPKLKLKLFPLLFRSINIAEFSADSEKADLILTEDKVFMLGDYPLKFDKKDNKLKFDRIYLNFGEYNISLDDRLNKEKVALKGKYVKNAKYIANHKIKFTTEADFIVSDKVTPIFTDIELDLPLNNFSNDKLKIDAEIIDLDLSSIGDYVNVFTGGIIRDLRGTLNLKAETKKIKNSHKRVYTKLSTKNLEVLGADKPSSVIHHKPLNLNINFETVSGGIVFKDTSFVGEGIKILFDGKISDSGKKIPAMDFNLEIKPSKLESACALLPWLRDMPKEMDFYKFKQYGVWGNGEGKLHFVGKGERPKVYGDVLLSKVDAIQRGIVAPEGTTVKMHFRGYDMDIDVYVPVLNNQFVEVKGFAKIDGTKYSELDISSSASVDLAPAKIILDPLHEMLKFKTGPVPIMKVKGVGNIHVQSKGKKVDPHLWGKINFRNSTAEFNQIHNLVLNNASGEVLFDNRDISFKTDGTINSKKASIYGKCNVFGDLDVIAKTSGQNIPDIIKVINSSPDMRDVQRVVKPFTQPQGFADLNLNIYGNAHDVTHVQFNKDIFAKGKIILHNASTVLKDTNLPFKNVEGIVNFNKKDADYNVTGNIRNSKLSVKGMAHDREIDLVASSDKFKLIDILELKHHDMFIPFKKEIGELIVSFTGKYKGVADADNLEYNKVIANGKISPNRTSANTIKVYSGDFNVKDGVLYGNNITGNFDGNPYNLSFEGTDIFNSMKIRNAEFNFNDLDVSSFSSINNLPELPKNYKEIVDNITDIRGNIDINGKIKNGGIYSSVDLKNLSFVYKPYDAVVKILSGRANMSGDTLYLSKINSKVSSMPVFLSGNISNIFKNPNANMYLSGKFNQEFFDKFINEKAVYPVKLRGDANFNAKINGTLNNLHANTTLNVAQDSSIYYMGATLAGAPSGISTNEGISTNPVSIVADTNIFPNKVKINSFNYNQIISSQNKKDSVQNQLSMSGIVSFLDNNVLKFDNLKIKTFEPTDAKIFNIILKKPTIKQGIFSTDLVLNGTSEAPKAKGNLNITSIDIPLLDATIRDVDVDFRDDYIFITSKGVILTNDITLLVKVLNNPQPPYIIEDMQFKTDVLDLNIIANRFNDYDTDKLRSKQVVSGELTVSPDMIIIKNGEVLADSIIIKKAQATNFQANMNIDSNGMLKITNYTFDLANGKINGNITSNLKTMDSEAVMNIDNANSEIIAENFFDMKGQVYGIVTGKLYATCKGLSSVECLNTLSGHGNFEVTDGRMPKLGSLEYLLKAANLVTGGFGAVSINGIIDLITPLKTGNFDKINGDIKVKNGVATDINVYSSGKELNMYLTGSYDFSTLVADMEVYGSLSKDFSTLLGKIGNASLNRLLNAIPGININEIRPESSSNIHKIPNFDTSNTLRVFKAEIFGDINGSNYVKSFKWIKH